MERPSRPRVGGEGVGAGQVGDGVRPASLPCDVEVFGKQVEIMLVAGAVREFDVEIAARLAKGKVFRSVDREGESGGLLAPALPAAAIERFS
jgi:hypothetical protein